MSETRKPFADYSNYSNVREHGTDEDQRPWNFLKVLKGYIPEYGRVLDVGTGYSFKLVELQAMGLTQVQFVGFDSNWKLLNKGKATIKNAPISGNIQLIQADILPPEENLSKEGGFPFPDNSFDVVTFMLSKLNTYEAHRVLKPGGITIMERIGEREKREAKLIFGDDEYGPRGYLVDYPVGSLKQKYTQDFEDVGFTILRSEDGVWKTRYDREGIETIFQYATTVRGFDPVKDSHHIDQIVERFSTPNGKIELSQHRILIIAQKPHL